MNDFNAAVLIPELKSAGKSVEVMTYPGMPHCFAFGAPGATEAMATSAKQAFRDMDEFFRGHLATQPKPVDPSRVSQVPAVAP